MSGSGLNVNKAVSFLDAHARQHSSHRCAAFVRQALEAGGLRWQAKTPGDAKDWGEFLKNYGFSEVSSINYIPAKGDVVVIQPYRGGNVSGHITMFDGKKWVSDFIQLDMWAGPGYRTAKPNHIILRP